MTASEFLEALHLPAAASVDRRVPKTLLVEHGAPTAADRRLIDEGIEELRWVAALKPTTVGIPAFRDETREYLEVAVLFLTLRPGAKAGRLRELVHRAIPYPVLLVTVVDGAVTLSTVHLRKSHAEREAFVLDGDVLSADASTAPSAAIPALLENVRLDSLPRTDLFTLYQAWMEACLAVEAARVTGSYSMTASPEATEARRVALEERSRLGKEIERLRAQASREPQVQRRVEMNLAIRTLTEKLAALTGTL